jgi:type I restriction enzyme S subunit
MSSEWMETDWGSIATLEYGKGLRDYRSGSGAYPVYGTNGQVGHCESFLCPHAGIVVGRKGAYRGIHYSANPFYVIDTAYWLKPKIDLDLKWAYYELLRQDVNSLDSGSAIPSTTRDAFYSLDVFLPPMDEQKAIAHILGTLDDKIELNRKTNETLEAMAKALFKSWFVDFDPVRAKVEGRPTGLPAEISDLFPDSFEDSELGEIPSGWKVAELGDCSLDIESGRRPKGGIDKNLAFGIPSIGAESISPIGQFDFAKTKWVDDAFAQSSGRGWIRNYDVALYKDGGKPGEFRPRTALYGDGFPFDKAMVNEHVFLLRSSQLGQPYLYYLFNFDLVLAQIIHKGSSKGAQPGLNQEEVRTSRFVNPDKRLLDVFNRTVESSIKRQLLIGRECQVLSQLRDSLLPKLISGEIRIPDAEKMLEEVGV